MTEVVGFLDTVRRKYRLYSSYVIGFRHFAEGRDGLKPVQRRALWTMHRLGAVSKPHMSKTAAVAGATMGWFHPHEDGSISGAICNMSQSAMASPPVIGVGNWGSHDQEPAAPRYTSCYLSPYALSMLDADELACVPMDPSFDGKNREPRFLPARLPHLLIGGCDSLAPGYKGLVPPCPPDWVAECVASTLEGRRLKPPPSLAYRWGGVMRDIDAGWLKTGTGPANFVPRLRLERGAIIMASLAPRLSVTSAEDRLQDDPAFAGLTEETAPPGEIVRVVIRVRRGHDPREFALRVRKACATRVHYSFLRIEQKTGSDGDVDYEPVIEGPASFLKHWVEWRLTIVVAAARHRADGARAVVARTDLLMATIDQRRRLLALLDSRGGPTAEAVMRILSCTRDQAAEVLAISWPRLARMERPPLEARRREALARIRSEEAIVRVPSGRLLTDAGGAVAAVELSRAEAAKMTHRKVTRGRGKSKAGG